MPLTAIWHQKLVGKEKKTPKIAPCPWLMIDGISGAYPTSLMVGMIEYY